MNDGTHDNLNRNTLDAGAPQASPEVEALLREWHVQNAARAAAGRERLMAAVREGAAAVKGEAGFEVQTEQTKRRVGARGEPRSVLGRIFMNRYSPLAAATLAIASVMVYFVSTVPNRGSGNGPLSEGGGSVISAVDDSANLALIRKACDDRYVMAPDGGRLDAVDAYGNVLGPCILKHTDVDVRVSGFISRVNVKQVYVNPHSTKVETVYTFPLSERAAVDRMKMTIGSREIEGQVKERAEAQRIYREAKSQGRIASLLEQERPNIFTQSIANIEPQAEIAIEISYVEVLAPKDGEYSLAFPTTIGPRYIPGEMRTWEIGSMPVPATRPTPAVPALPSSYATRRGIVLIGPASVAEMTRGDTSKPALSEAELRDEITRAKPARLVRSSGAGVWYNFVVRYEDGAKEMGTLLTDGAGMVNGRWFYSAELARIGGVAGTDDRTPREWKRDYPSTGFNIPAGAGERAEAEPRATGGTTSVPDAGRITPVVARPDRRSGQDISITVQIEPGGPGVYDIKSESHAVRVQGVGEFAKPPMRDEGAGNGELPRRVVSLVVPRAKVELSRGSEIPNKDFTLSWKVAGGIDEPVVLTHTGPQGNFFLVSLLPPAKAEESRAVPREIMFVLDRSGSMSGFKLEQAKALIDATLATMRPSDTFNVLCFSNVFETLWSEPRRATAEHVAQARAFYGRSEGSGGTEMLKVISTALAPGGRGSGDVVRSAVLEVISAEAMVNLPADGREVIVDVPTERFRVIESHGDPRRANRVIVMNGGSNVNVRVAEGTRAHEPGMLRLVGAWKTENGERVLVVSQVEPGAGGERAEAPGRPMKPLRIVAFITDGEIGNDMEVLAAIKRHRGDARVFSFAVGNSPNRYLLDGMARLGRGEVDYVPLNADPSGIIERFTRRVSTPVLTDIRAAFSDELAGTIQKQDVYTALGGGGGSGERVSDAEYIPDLYDQKPVIIVGRYNRAASGTLLLSGNAANGEWSRSVKIDLPKDEPGNSVIATLWARTKVESIMDSSLLAAQRGTIAPEQRQEIVTLGESFNLVTGYTSFVAVDRLRVTIGGASRLVQIPVEFEDGAEWGGYFGGPTRFNRGERENALLDAYNRLTSMRDGPAATVDLLAVSGESAVGFDPSVAVNFGVPVAPYDRVPQVDLSSMLGLYRFEDGAMRDAADVRFVVPAIEQKLLRLEEVAPATDAAIVKEQLARGLAPSTAPSSAGTAVGGGRGATPGAVRGGEGGTGGTAEPASPVRKSRFPSDPRPAGVRENEPKAPAAEQAEPAKPASAAPTPSSGGSETVSSIQSKRERERVEESLKKDAAGARRDETRMQKPAGADVADMDAAAPVGAEVQSLPGERSVVRVDPVERLRLLIEAAQASTKPEDRIGTWKSNDAAERVLIESYIAEVQGIADQAAAAQAALESSSDSPAGDHVDATETTQGAANRTAGADRATGGRTVAVRPVRREEIAMHIGVLANQKKLAEAAEWATVFGEVFAGYSLAAEMLGAANDVTLSDEMKRRAWMGVAERAASELAREVRRIRLMRRVQAELLPLAMGGSVDAESGSGDALPAGVMRAEGGIVLSVVVRSLNDDVVRSLNSAGMRVDSRDPQTRVVVGVVPLDRVDDVALVEGVRRVEVTRE